jgi:hypothetical protein
LNDEFGEVKPLSIMLKIPLDRHAFPLRDISYRSFEAGLSDCDLRGVV